MLVANNSVEKGLQILECFSKAQPHLTLEEIASITGFPKTTAFRLIKSLEKYGYLKRNKAARETRFSLGWVFLNKSNIVLNQLSIREAAHDHMRWLRNETGLTVQLAIRDREEAVYVDQIELLKPIKVYPQIGRKAPLYVAACPRVLLAYLSESEREDILKRLDFKSYPRIPDKDAIKAELQKVKKEKYAISYGELYKGTIAIASPVLINENQAIASISVIGLEQDFDGQHLEKAIRLVKECTQKVSLELK